MRKTIILLLLTSGGTLMAQDKTLVTVHGEKVDINTGDIKPEPWYDFVTNTGATSNTSSIYMFGNSVGIGSKGELAGLTVGGPTFTPGVASGHLKLGSAGPEGGKVIFGPSDAGGRAMMIDHIGGPGYEELRMIDAQSGLGLYVRRNDVAINMPVSIADGTQGDGKVLTSDANGNARWADPTPVPTEPWMDYNTRTGATGTSDAIYKLGSSVGIGTIQTSSGLTVGGPTTQPGMAVGQLTLGSTGPEGGQINLSPSDAGGAAFVIDHQGAPGQESLRLFRADNAAGLYIYNNRIATNLRVQIIDGTQGAGKILVCDASGKSYWADPSTLQP